MRAVVMAQREDQFRDRLRSEGKMPAFKNRVKELREEGVPKADSWGQAAAEFGYVREMEQPENDHIPFNTESLVKAVQSASEAFAPAETEVTETGAMTLPTEIQFAMDNMHRIGHPLDPNTWCIEPTEAPSAAAWSMLKMAVRNQAQFMRLVFGQLTESHKKAEELARMEAADAALEDYWRQKAEESEPLSPEIGDCPKCGAHLVLPIHEAFRGPDEQAEIMVLDGPDENPWETP
jgi:hypothetical protein